MTSEDDLKPPLDRARRYLVIGTTVVARRVCWTLTQEGADVVHLGSPTDDELRAATAREPAGVAVVMHDDVACLRYALAVAHVCPRARLVVSVFDRTVGQQLRRLLPGCVIASPADIAAPTLTGACVAQDLLAVDYDSGGGTVGVGRAGPSFRLEPYRLPASLRWRALLGRMRGQLRPHDAGSRIFLAGLIGLLAVLAADWLWATLVFHHDPIGALYTAVSVVSTVGPANAAGASAEGNSVAYQVFATVAMFATIGFTATFTAGIVQRILDGRWISLVGRRVAPVDGHVVVVGLGQVGLRLCVALRSLGLGVIAVERNPAAENLRIARSHRIPVLVAHAEDRGVLARLRLHRAVALAAVGSDDLDNIAVALTAMAVAPRLRIVLRAGDGEAIAESKALLRIAAIRDVTALSATQVILSLRQSAASLLFSDGVHVYAQLDAARPEDVKFADYTAARTADCSHLGP